MTAVEDLAATRGRPDPMAAAEELTSLLDLDTVGLRINGARIVGQGSSASADVYLSNGDTITFETLRDVGKAANLMLEVAACTGATPHLKAPQALRAVALLRALAEHHRTVNDDDLTVEWCLAYLQAADVLDTTMGDQQERWGAFARLDQIDPGAARAAGGTLGPGLVLRDVDGLRYVRTGWFRDYVRGVHDPTASPRQITHRVERVGWRPARWPRGDQGHQARPLRGALVDVLRRRRRVGGRPLVSARAGCRVVAGSPTRTRANERQLFARSNDNPAQLDNPGGGAA
jgi:hypothetical protein